MKRKLLFVAAVVASVLGFNANAQEKPVPASSPLVDDGETIQYLYNVKAGAFWLGANEYRTRASVAPVDGFQFKVINNNDGTWKFLDRVETKANQWMGVFINGDGIWVDNNSDASISTWIITPTGEGDQFTITNNKTSEGNLAIVPSKNDNRLYFSKAEDAQDVWIAVSEEDYKQFLVDYKKTFKVGDNIIDVAPVAWDYGVDGNKGTFGDTAFELFRPNNLGSAPAGDVITQTITDLKNGIYTVSLKLAANCTNGRDNCGCPTGEDHSFGFANDQEQSIKVVDKGDNANIDNEYITPTFTVKVTDGTLKYGIKNKEASGNWYVASVTSIVFTAEAITTQYGVEYALIGENLIKNGSFEDGLTDWKATNYETDAKAADFTIVDEGGFDGGKYIITNAKGVGDKTTIRQSVAVTPGKKYLFTVYTSGQAPDAANIQYNGLYAMTDNKTEVDKGLIVDFGWPQGASKTTEEWSKTEYVFTAAENQPNVGVRLSWNANSHFDGFSLYEVELLSSEADEATANAKVKKLNALYGDYTLVDIETSSLSKKVAAITASKTVEEVEAIQRPMYTLTLTTSEGLQLTVVDNKKDGIKITKEGTPFHLDAMSNNAYAISPKDGEYINYEGSNDWSLLIGNNASGWTAALKDGAYSFKGSSNKGHLGTNDKEVDENVTCYGDKSNANIYWVVAEYIPSYTVEVKDESGYASYVTTADVAFDGIEAYIVSEVIEDDEQPKAQLVAITEAPKGTPVIVKAEAAGTHTIYAVDRAKAIEDGANLLKVGTGEETGEGVYVLANPAEGEGIGFYALEDEVKVPEGKVYLAWTAAPGEEVKFIGFDGYEYDATAIKVVETPAPAVENGIYYNLSGQRVQAPTKGIYIVNGKKVLVK